MNVKERIKIFIKHVGIPISSFEDSINVANGYVNSISKSIGVDKINKILEVYPNLNLEWLFTGEGEMLKSEGPAPERKPPDERDRLIIELQQHRIQSLEKDLSEREREIDQLKKELKTAYDRSVVR